MASSRCDEIKTIHPGNGGQDGSRSVAMSTKPSNSTVTMTKKVYWKVPIPNFSRMFFSQFETGKFIESETFSISNGSKDKMTTKWFLYLRPNGKTEQSKSNVGLYLGCKNAKETVFDFTARYKFGVKKDNSEDCFIKSEFVRPKEELTKAGRGYPKFLSHEQLFKEENGYVVGGKLVVFVELTVEVEIAKPPPKIARSFCSDFKKMFENEAFCDFALKTSDDKVLKAHRFALAARSPMFYAMLTTDMEESKQGSASVPDFDSKVMKEVLRYIYCNEVKGLGEIAPELIYAAEKYQLEELKEICLQEITSSLQVGNAVKLLIIAYRVSDAEELYEKSLHLIANNYWEASKKPSWKDLPKELLFEIIDSMSARYNVLRI